MIGVMGVAGDRRDEDILRMGELAAQAFDELIIREDELRRGRRVGEGARLITEGALSSGFDPAHVQTILKEPEAVDAALRLAAPGDLVVLLATEVEDTWQQMRDFDSSAALAEPEMASAAWAKGSHD
ncbi:glutamate ligase domain-containing protein [Deinococcus malanensis]|uniref:glutamate ligase domain-containing protein n=1 Tax=Deinococcus malanensis TaxID=1706855 RepID=UPI003629953F